MNNIELVLFGDPFNHIFKYLDSNDLASLLLTCKKFNKIIKEKVKWNTIKKLNNKLSKIFLNDINEFYNLLQKNEAVISGCYITQTILGENWKNYLPTIDIFVFDEGENNINELDNFLTSRYLKRSEHGDFPINNYYSNLSENIGLVKIINYSDKYSYETRIICLKDAQFDERTKIEKLKNYIWNYCDLSIGKNIYYIDKDGRNQLEFCHLYGILNKQIDITYKSLGHIQHNYLIYTGGRCFTFSNIKKDETNMFSFRVSEDESSETYMDRIDAVYLKKIENGKYKLLSNTKNYITNQLIDKDGLVNLDITSHKKNHPCPDICFTKIFNLPCEHFHIISFNVKKSMDAEMWATEGYFDEEGNFINDYPDIKRISIMDDAIFIIL